MIVMKIYHYDRNPSMWLNFIIVTKNYHLDENSSLWLNFILKIHNSDEIHLCDENWTLWAKFIILMKFILVMNSSSVENSALLWKSMIGMKIYHYDRNCWDESSSPNCLMRITLVKIDQFDHWCDKKSSQRWNFVDFTEDLLYWW